MGSSTAIIRVFQDCASGSQEACNEFFAEQHQMFRRVAARIANQYRCSDEVDDLVQEICLKITRQGRELAGSLPADDQKAQAYFATLAANTCRDWFRARGHRPNLRPSNKLSELVELLGEDPGYDKALLIAQMERLLPADPRDRTIFQLYYRQGFSAAEIAALPTFGLSVKGVESLLVRVRNDLRRAMKITKGAARAGAS